MTSAIEESGHSIERQIMYQSYLKFIAKLSLDADHDGRPV